MSICPHCNDAAAEKLRAENERLRANIEEAENMLCNSAPYGHIAALLRGTLQGRARNVIANALDGEKG